MFATLTNPACADSTVDFHDGRPAVVALALIVCAGCPEKADCLSNALAAEAGEPKAYRFGVFGGTTPDERFAIQNPQTSGQSLTEAR